MCEEPLMNREDERFKGDPLYELEGVKLALGELEAALKKSSGLCEAVGA